MPTIMLTKRPFWSTTEDNSYNCGLQLPGHVWNVIRCLPGHRKGVTKSSDESLRSTDHLMNAPLFSAPTKRPTHLHLYLGANVLHPLGDCRTCEQTNVIKFLLADQLQCRHIFNRVLLKHLGWVPQQLFSLRCEIAFIYYLPECLLGTDNRVPLQLNAVMQYIAATLSKLAKARSSKTSSQSNVWC